MSRIANEQFHNSASPTRPPNIADVMHQIEAEYREMPGLSVTEAQAQRLWALDRTTCRRALDTLVHRGVLRRTRRESYVRAEIFSRTESTRGGETRSRPDRLNDRHRPSLRTWDDQGNP